MPTYFKPLRRKIGVVTLVLACVVLVDWGRSRNTHDTFYGSLFNQDFAVISDPEGIGLRLHLVREDRFKKSGFYATRPAAQERLFQLKPLRQHGLRFDHQEIICGGVQFFRSERWLTFKVDQVCIVIPLTLLSAWLLLSKPRAGKLCSDSRPTTV